MGIIGFIYEERMAAEPIIPLALFRNRSFLLCSLIGFVIGMSLFGSVTFLPLYLQVVKEATPTEAGLQLIPLMGGLLLTSIISGRIISRTGKYRLFPILGTLLGVTGMVLLTRITIHSPLWQLYLFTGVLGAGLGLVMQVLVLAAEDHPQLLAQVAPANYRARIERLFLFHLQAFDWNCPQHITPRYSAQQVAEYSQNLQQRIHDLEQENQRLQQQLARIGE